MAPDRPALYLLEHHPTRPSGADLARLHRALVYAVSRLARSGVPVTQVRRIVQRVDTTDIGRHP